MSHDQKVITLLPPMKKCIMDFYIKELFLLLTFDNSSPSINRDKEIVKVTLLWDNDVSTSLGGVPNGTLWMGFIAVQIWCF